MLFSYFENKEKEKEPKEKPPVKLPEPEEPKVQEKEKEKEKENKKSSVSMLKSSSTENTNTNNEANESSEKPVSKSPSKLNQPNLTNIPPMIVEEQITSPIHLTDEETANTPSVKKRPKSPHSTHRRNSFLLILTHCPHCCLTMRVFRLFFPFLH